MQTQEPVSVVIPRNTLRVALIGAASDDVRKYLEGVALIAADGWLKVVATDGHMLIAHNTALPVSGAWECVVPRDALEKLLRLKADKHGVDDVEIHVAAFDVVEGWGAKVTIGTRGRLIYQGTTIDFQTVGLRFPDWQRVVSAETNGETAQFAPQLLARMGEAMRLIQGKPRGALTYPTTAHNGNGAALVGLGSEDWLGVVMPRRCDSADVPRTPPAWVKTTANAPAAKTA